MATRHTPPRVTVTIEDEGFADGLWIAHYFTVNRKHYFLPHTPEEPFWELMEDIDEEYITVAVGEDAVRTWLHAHNVQGIL